MILNYFDMFILKIIFKKYYFKILSYKINFKKLQLTRIQTN
jgi:hypothetical protein